MSQEIPKILAEFENYCSEEREHRQNAGGQFDAELFDEAVELAIRQINNLLGGDA
ncbi:MAG: hypothetical protein P8Z31_12725 [Gammaproteobacteria bacterium]|jgi:hypothetical protein